MNRRITTIKLKAALESLRELMPGMNQMIDDLTSRQAHIQAEVFSRHRAQIATFAADLEHKIIPDIEGVPRPNQS